MIKNDFLDAVRQLELQPENYVVIGSGVLGALGLREVDDVDVIVSEPVFEEFEKTGAWRKKPFDDGTYYLLNGMYEIGLDWDSPEARPNLAELKKDQLVIEGVPFISLERLKRWKLRKGREKDLADVALIEQHLSSKHNVKEGSGK